MLTRTGRRRLPVLLILIVALSLFLAGAPARAQEGSAPDAPTGLTVASVSHDSVELDWDDSGDSSITHYQVFRRDRAVHDAGEFVIIEGDTGSTATEYTDATVEADEEYVYRVKAVNAYGASPWSDHVRADTPTGPGQETVYTYEDGDRTIRVILQGDLVVQETGADTPSDGVVRRAAGGNIVRKQSGDGGADLPVFRSASGGALMTLPGGVLLALDPEWDEAMVNGFFARNNISKGRVSELDYIPNGFFVRTEPGFPSLELANALAAQKGVLLSSPNWWREVGTRQDPGETKGDDREGTQEARRIEPRNEDVSEAYDLPLDGSYTAQQTTISPAGDRDYFKLDLSSQIGVTDVRIYTTGEFDTIGILYDSRGIYLTENDDSFGTDNFSLLASLSPGVYYVTVAGQGYYIDDTTVHDSTGFYKLHSEAVTATSVTLGSSVDANISAAGEVDYFKLDLSGQTGDTDVSLFTLSDDLELQMEAPVPYSRVRRGNLDVLGDVRWVFHLNSPSLSQRSHLLGVWRPDTDLGSETGDYSLRAAAVPNHGNTTGTATVLNLDAPTSGKITYSIDADYFKLVLREAKDLAIMALAYDGVDVVVLNSGGTKIPVNEEKAPRDHKIIDSFAPGTYYVKITAPGARSSTPVHYALYAYEDTGYGEWSGDCADATNDLSISTIDDPLYACQWHLNRGDRADMDINVESVWAGDITGAGVNVAVVDNTIDYSHADLSSNINSALNHDYGRRSNAYRPADHHGTNIAGVIAALDNTIGVRGVAPEATIYGHNFLADGYAYSTDVNEADAMARNRVVTAVSNNSWGAAGGYGLSHAFAVWEMAIDSGLTEGYGGKGVFYAFAGGNDHEKGDNSNFNEYANYYGVTAVCAVGDDRIRAAYSEQGANLWVCAPSSGGDRGIVTTENSDRYINDFSGTSAATPIISGVAALLRHANRDLTWRDLKLILAASARQNDASNRGWENGARKYGSSRASDVYHFNHEYGFGMVDAAAAVALAQDWSTLPEFKNASSASDTLDGTIPNNSDSGITSSLTLDTSITFTEFVEVNVTIDHSFWRDLQIELTSPAGTVSTLAVPLDRSLPDVIVNPVRGASPGTFRFGSAKHLGEEPNGTWELRVADLDAASGATTVSNISQAEDDNVLLDHQTKAQTFTTGSSAGGYTLASVKIVSEDEEGHDFTAAVYTVDSDGHPATVHAALTAPDRFAKGTLIFTAPANTILQPNTTYALVLDRGTDTMALDTTEAEEEDDGHATGWSIADAYHFRSNLGNWVVTGRGESIRIAIDAAPGTLSDWSIKVYGHGNSVSAVSTGRTTATATVELNNPDSESLTVHLRYSGNDGSTWSTPMMQTTTGTSVDFALTGLAPNGKYVLEASLDNTFGESSDFTADFVNRPANRDIDTLTEAGNTVPTGLWSNDTAIWVSDSEDDKIYAYTLVNGERDSDKDIDTLAAGNTEPIGLWSNDTTIWVVDVGEDKIYAYTLVNGERDSDKDIDTLAAGNTLPVGLWSDGTTIWVVNNGRGLGNKIYAYTLANGARDSDKDINTLAAAGNINPYGLWSDSATMWVAHFGGAGSDAKIYAYTLATGARDSDRDIDTLAAAGNDDARGLWSDDTTIWVADGEDDKLYAYYILLTPPDLVVDPLTVSPSSPLAGASFTLSTTVRNQGGSEAVGTTLTYYQSTNATIDASDSSVGADAVSRLAAAATSAESIDLAAPSAAGTYYYRACVSTVTNESNTTNNCSTAVRVTVRAPDLVVGTPNVSDDSLTAGAFTLRATVSNLGSAASTPTLLRYYQSTNATIDTRDTAVGTASEVGALDAGTSSDELTSVTAPTTAGTYYYGACVDAVANESNTTNNCSTGVEVTVLPANAAPEFTSSATFNAAENQTRVGTVQATDDDAGDDVTGYAITSGADWRLFSIEAMSGALTFKRTPNYEDAQDQGTNNTYMVVVRATSGTGTRLKTATQTITVTVTDMDTEAPGTPGTPRVSAESASSLSVNWSAPSNAGPAITDYDVQYRSGTSGSFSLWSHNGTATTATIGSLSENTSYQVQVRATNAEGTGAWSDSGSDRTDANAAPSFSSPATFDAAENQTSAGTVQATDTDPGDNITGYAITGGADRSLFSIGATSGALTFDAVPNYEDPQDQGSNNTYVVTVTATSGAGTRVKTATQTITVTVTDVGGEAPGKPAAPTVSSASATSLSVNWSAPDNAGPAITDYDVRYRAGTSGSWRDGGHNGAATTATLTGLSENTFYQVQVRATNAEGTGSWSDAGSGTTDANAAPVFRSSSAFDAAENQTTVGTVWATDSDAGDDVTGYAISGGADRRFFSIVETSGALTFKTAPNYEAAQDQGTGNTYMVIVTATSGMRPRVKTATQTITVTVTDVDTEAPGRPGEPSVSAASATSLRVNWSAPSNAGPAITDYDVQYREGTSGGWSTKSHNGTATTATLTGLSENTLYQVQVRASNAEGTGAWSDSGSGRTDANAAPSFTSPAAFDAAENRTRVGTVQAMDADDNITGYAITGGEDQSFFSIGVTSGVLTFNTAPTHESPQDDGNDNTYMVEVTATSGAGPRVKTATQTITVTVTMAAAPDLVVDEPRVTDSSPLTGASFTLSATVRNRGSAAAARSTLTYYRSSDATIDTNDSSVGTDAVSRLAAAATSAESIDLAAPATAGTYYYGACVGTVTNESNTGNNCSTAVTVTVVAPPDLVVVTPSVSDSNPEAERPFTLRVTVGNEGGAAASTTLTYYRSTNTTIDTNDRSVGMDPVSGLGAGTSSPQSISVTAPATKGTYYYGACVEPAQNESDTTNNCSVAVAVTVGTASAPDLVVESPSVTDSSPLTGAPFTLSVTVRNQGSAASGNSTTLTYYRSTNSTIDTSDSSVGTNPVSGLAAAATNAESIDLAAPTTAGIYYYGACVDTLTNESDTANNCSAAVRVTVGVAPVFTDGANTERKVAENSAPGANVGSAVRATDADNDTLTYSLKGPDEASFSIVAARGQIRTAADLDHEARSSYSVTVTADDGKGGTATIAVIITVTDVNEPPTVNGQNLVTIFENQGLSASYSAIDPERDEVTWSVTGRDRGDFNIDRNTGKLTFRNTPNYERPADSDRNNEYLVTVRAYDGRYYGSKDVTVTVEDENEPPTITTTSSSATALRQNENVTSRLYTYRATDPERETITWSVEGADKDFFTIDESGGQLYFLSPPSFEVQETYSLIVSASDGTVGGSLNVTVTVENVEEPGVVTITPPRGWVDDTTFFSAVLDDDDGVTGNIDWKWERSPNRRGWTVIDNETFSSYTAAAADANQYLRATATYTDALGSNKTAEAVLSTPVGDVRPAANTAPEFTETGPVTRTVREGTAAGRNVGFSVRATDADQGDVLTYSLQSGTDADAFDIDPATGQIRTKDVLIYNPDPDMADENEYTVTVSVHDGFGGSYFPSTASDATLDVTIMVTAAPVVVRRPPTGGGGGGRSRATPTPTPTPSPTPTPTGPQFSGEIAAEPSVTATVVPEGTTLGVNGGGDQPGGVYVNFPPIAVALPVQVSVSVSNEAPSDVEAPSGTTLLPLTIDITPETPLTLGTPLTIEINPTPEQLEAAGGDLNHLAVGVVTPNGIVVLPTQVMHGRLVVTIDHLSTFVLVAITDPGPVLRQPPMGDASSMGPLLQWTQPPETTWFQVQVIPFNEDGPGINLVIGDSAQVRAAQYQVMAPNFGSADPNYVLLPDMTYLWRVRTSTVLTNPTEADWSAWAASSFKTPPASSSTITRVAPPLYGEVSTLTPTLTWANSNPAVFYYEVQVSRDFEFGPNAFLYSEYVHGGASTPPNSYVVPEAFPLEAGAIYYWRVRPRIQGDGDPLPWSRINVFQTPG